MRPKGEKISLLKHHVQWTMPRIIAKMKEFLDRGEEIELASWQAATWYVDNVLDDEDNINIYRVHDPEWRQKQIQVRAELAVAIFERGIDEILPDYYGDDGPTAIFDEICASCPTMADGRWCRKPRPETLEG